MHEYEPYVGQPLEVLTKALQREQKTIRIVKLNGATCIVTNDVQVNRLNIVVNNNIVSAVLGFG